ncbi:hypothetical protein [Winogradskyella haliclonae]|uniref:Zincin peptidase n=1 Tax=Winogradskyella haliclonae TaxID=2048558 RepID=A0ABQ2BZT8_9FLAO|nr:hypothetical protein [Winogradskyella haliclonae]GGI57992.1 hypothetical protein GCM10011444_23010 [Winogradskyella haliclonae]
MIKLKITWRYCLAFYCIIMLYVSLHELIHHLAGYLICGDWGIKTFNYFETACDNDKKSLAATYIGPIFTFMMMYFGMYLLKKRNSEYKKHLGFAIIFAQLPFQRMISPFFRMNDEFYASSKLFGNTNIVYWSVIILIWLICLPPLIKAFQAIGNRNKILWFLFYLILFPYLLWGPIFGGLEYLMVEKKILSQSVIGIGLLFILNEIVTIVAYYFTKKYINPNQKDKNYTQHRV